MEFSKELNEIFEALSKFREGVTQPKKDASNPQFKSKYVDLDNVVNVVDAIGPKHGLAYAHNITSEENTVSVQVLIAHKSGQYILFDPLTLDARPTVKGGGVGRATSQSKGSAITYGRRYTLSSAFGIASEVDDDGNSATGEQQTQPYSNQQQNQPLEEKQPTFPEWVNMRYDELGKLTGWDKEEITVMLEGKAGSSLKGLERERVVAVIKESIAEIKKSSVVKKASGGDWID